ncbi:unnamed protein product [Gongylonema pulchrum]|uniref:SUI1 domain-containing protein n=1 Tax=Gongylonema pulchrum TaxID=637853 RepID=A0A183DTW4_9BILA|nr:unnamed protein product [Gongylonema pulchrum]
MRKQRRQLQIKRLKPHRFWTILRLEHCFLAALKHRVTKKGQLPLDIGEFYSRYLLPCVPPDRHIDMKKTIYKKFVVFLERINENESGPIVKIAMKQKGSEMITEINWEHPLLVNFKLSDEIIIDDKKEEKKTVEVGEYFAVTGPVLPIFQGHREKGDLLDKKQARRIITTYVKSRNECADDRVVPTDETLKSLLKAEEPVDWNTLFQKIMAKMTKTYVITLTDGRQLIRKMELPKIVFKVENRAGHKKVTTVNNLSTYGIECKKFCHEIQTGVAASASIVNVAPNCEGPQVLVQGNQISFMANLLLTKYGIDKKYMNGLELIPKKR